MRPEDPRGPCIAKVVLISAGLAAVSVFQGCTVGARGGARVGGPRPSMANRGAFSRFEAA